MRAAALLFVLAGCVQTQDLGGDPQPQKPNDNGLQQATTGGREKADPAPTLTLAACPATLPVEQSACEIDVGWCNYPLPLGRDRHEELALAQRCTCGVDHRWACVLVRAQGSHAPPDLLPLTSAACIEGAPCAASVRCSIAHVRTCGCTSSGRLLCTKPTQ